MKDLSRISVSGLRWVLGGVVLLQSVHFALSAGAAQHLDQAGLPLWTGPALAWTEAVAAVLFALPMTTIVGSYGLLLSFAAAIAIHFREGDFGVGGLIVYATCVLVCLAHRETKVSGKTA